MRLKKILLNSTLLIISLLLSCCIIVFGEETNLYFNDSPNETQNVIVKYKDNIKMRAKATLSAENTNYFSNNIALFSGDNESIDNLKNDENVEYVEVDSIIKKMSNDIYPSSFEILHVPQIHSKDNYGNGIKIAIFDTGINSPNGEINLSGGISFVDGVTSFADDNGHGTAIAGIIAAQFNDYGLAGVAPQSEIYSVKVLDSEGNGRYSNLIRGINWAIENDIDIICLSLGGKEYSRALEDVIMQAYNSNILMIAAAGNEVSQTATYPAKFNQVLSVGAVDNEGNLTNFSNYGNYIDVLAPGESIESILYINDKPTKTSGTSAANAHVVGVAALIWSENQNYTANEVSVFLCKTATGGDDKSLYGIIDANNSSVFQETSKVFLVPEEAMEKVSEADKDEFMQLLSSGTFYEIEPNNTSGSADRIYHDYDNYGKISSASDVDWYKIKFNGQRKVNFYLGDIPAGCDYDLYLYDSNGTTLLTNTSMDNINPTTINGVTEVRHYDLIENFQATGNKDYYLKVVSYSGYNNSSYYLLKVNAMDIYEKNDTRATATVISNNVTISATINNADDVDYYKLYLNAGETLAITLSGLPKDYDLYLYNANGTEVAYSSNGSTGDENIEYYVDTTTKAGYYYIYVVAYQSVSSDENYTLTVETIAPQKDNYENHTKNNINYSNNNSNNNANLFENIVSPKVIYANIHINTDEDWYSFYAPTGTVTIRLDELPKDYDLFLMDYYSSTLVLASSEQGSTTSEYITYYTSTPRMFAVRVKPYQNNFAREDYKLTISFDKISNLYYTADFTDNTFEFTWQTPFNADSKLLYGLSSDNLNQSVSNSTATSNHSLIVDNFNSFSKYYVQAQSKVTSGGVASATVSSDTGSIYSQDANEPNQTYQQATYLRLNNSKQGTIYHYNDIDFYEIYLDTPGYVGFYLTSPSGLRYVVNLWDGYNGVYVDVTNSIQLLNEGTYYFYISGFSEMDCDPQRLYTIEIEYTEYVYATQELHFGGNGTYAATGNYSQTFNDLHSVVAGTEFNISRIYNSRDNYNNHFSRGWMFNFEGKISSLERKILMSDGTIQTTVDNNYKLVRLPDSSTQLFKVESNNTFTAEDSRNVLVKNADGTYTLKMTDQINYTFNANGYLTMISDRNNNNFVITVNASGKVQNITDYVGNVYTIAYQSNRIYTISDTFGRIVTYGYDGNGRLNSVNDSTGKYTYYTYHTLGVKTGYLKEVKDQSQNILQTVDYYTNSIDTQKVYSIKDVFGTVYEYAYDEISSKTIITEKTVGASNNRIIEQSYDTTKYIKTSKDAENGTSTLEYSLTNGINKYGEVKKSTDRNNNMTEYIRDANGNPTKIINPDLSFKEFGYDVNNNVIWMLDEEGNFVRYIYDEQKLNIIIEAKYMRKLSTGEIKPQFIESGIDANIADYAVTRYSYYPNLAVKGLVYTITAPDGGVTTFYYDAKCNLSSVENPESTTTNQIVTVNEYNNMGLPSALVTDKGYRTEFTYNNNGQQIKQINKASTGDEVLRTIYDANGNKAQVISPKQYNAANEGAGGSYTDNTVGERNTYYPGGFLETTTDAENNPTSYTYDRYGNKETETKPNGAVYIYTYDGLNRVKTVKFKEDSSVPDANAVLLENYDYTIVNKQPIVTIKRYITTSSFTTVIQTYDYAGQLLSEYTGDSTDNKTVSLTYYKNGEVKTTTDGRGNVTHYKYGSFDSVNKLRYDEIWRPFDGDQFAYSKKVYNKKGNMVQEVTSKDTVALNAVPTTNLVEIDYAYYKDDKKKTITDNEGRKTACEYDNDRNLSKEEHYYSGTGKNVIEYVNNHLGKPTTVKTYIGENEIVNPDGTPYVGSFITTTLTYDKNGNLWTVISPKEHTITYGYDNLNRRTSISESGVDEYDSVATIGTFKQHDFAGNIIQTTDAKGYVYKNVYDKRGFLRYAINPENGVTFYNYDLLGRKIGEVKPKNYTGSVTLACANLDLLATDIQNLPNMSRAEYVYDAIGMLRQTKDTYLDPLSELWKTITQYTDYDGNGNLLTKKDGMGYITTNSYYKANILKTVLDPESSDRDLEYTVKYEYDALGRKIAVYNTQNARTDYTYSNAGKVKTIKAMIDGVQHLTQNNEYDLLDNLRFQTDGEGIVTEFRYNAFNKIKTMITDGDESIPSNTVESKYDVVGNVVITSDSCDVIELYTYDAQNRQTSLNRKKLDGTQSIITYTKYDLNGNIRFEQDGEENIKETTYTVLNRPYTVQVQGTAPITTYSYDKNGNLQTETDFRGNVKRTEYDPLNRLIQVYDAKEILIQTLFYNDNHVQVKSIDALEKETIFGYDKNNRHLYTTDPLWHTSGQTYDDAGFIETKYDGENNTTTYEYDELGRTKYVYQTNHIYQTNEDEIITTGYTYDLNGNVLTQTNGEEHTTAYVYNKGRKPKLRYDHGGEGVESKTETYGYDERGNLTSKTDRNGNNFIYTFDVYDRLTHTYVDGVLKIEETYDNNGNKRFMTDDSGTTERQYDSLNRVTYKNVPIIGAVSYQYDITLNLDDGYIAEKSTDPKGNITISIFDENNRLKQVKAGENATPAIYEYYDNGALETLTNSNGTSANYLYYDDGTLHTMTNKNSIGEVVDYYEYTYDDAKNQLTKAETIANVNRGITVFTYDDLNRLETVAEPSGKSTVYTYDGAGNRKTETITENNKSAVTTYYYNEQERLNKTVQVVGETTKIITYKYDYNGNVYSTSWELLSPSTEELSEFALYQLGGNAPQDSTAINEYDAFNRLVKTYEGNNVIVNTYNAEGLRVAKSVNDNTTFYLYEYERVLLETDANGNQTARNVYGTNLLSRTADGINLFYGFNGHADVTALTDGNGTVVASYYYDAFGVEMLSSGNSDNPYRYAGYEFDTETGLYYLKSRFYDAKIARFMQEDTYTGKINDPLSLNLYTYVFNNPIRYYDPTGYAAQDKIYINGIELEGWGGETTGEYWGSLRPFLDAILKSGDITNLQLQFVKNINGDFGDVSSEYNAKDGYIIPTVLIGKKGTTNNIMRFVFDNKNVKNNWGNIYLNVYRDVNKTNYQKLDDMHMKEIGSFTYDNSGGSIQVDYKMMAKYISDYYYNVTYEVKKISGAQYVTADQLISIGWSKSVVNDEMIQELNRVLGKYGINTTERIKHFLAQVSHESGAGQYKVELGDSNYLKYLEGRKDLGNTTPGDGLKYRGAGYIQLTGKSNYQKFANAMGDQRVMEGYRYVADNYAWEAAGYYWNNRNINATVDNGGTVEDVTRKVNGGTNGLQSRKNYYNKAAQVIK